MAYIFETKNAPSNYHDRSTGLGATAWISAFCVGFSIGNLLYLQSPLDRWGLYRNRLQSQLQTLKFRLQQVPWWMWMLGSFGIQENIANAGNWVWFPLVVSVLTLQQDGKGDDGSSRDTTRNLETEATLPVLPPDHEYSPKKSKDLFSMPPSSEAPKTTTSSEQQSPPTPQRYVEMLVHNVSHTDLVLSLDLNDTESYCLCRPRFSAFDMYCRRIWEVLKKTETTESLADSLIHFPSYKRQLDVRRSILPSSDHQQPTGFQLPTDKSLQVSQLTDLRVRGKDSPRLEHVAAKEEIQLNAVFFPLLATLLQRWHTLIEQKYSGAGSVQKVLLLVSGVGTPRNWTHSITGNSTQACAMLMKIFLQVVYPNVKVVLIHSETNIFRYDENILFVERELMPCINAYRDAHAQGLDYPPATTTTAQFLRPSSLLAKLTRGKNESSTATFDVDWYKSFSVILSFADGSPARTHAIQAALRTYRPSYFHFWQLKSFWHETKIVDDDIEVHSFEEMNTVPALETLSISDPTIRLVVDELHAFRKDVNRILQDEQRNDLMKFWMRKSHKVVLSVLLVQIPGQPKPFLYRGTNMEVSLPTGSLCAERNVIGTALAENPTLKREDLKLIACLAVPEPPRAGDDESTCYSVTPLATPTLRPSRSTASIPELSIDDWVQPALADGEEEYGLGKSPPEDVQIIQRQIKLYPAQSHTSSDKGNHTDGKASSKPKMGGVSQRRKRTVDVRSSGDLNPLRPCGACNEWLKKISEANPYFKILTFTDAECNGVYITPCQD